MIDQLHPGHVTLVVLAFYGFIPLTLVAAFVLYRCEQTLKKGRR